MDESLHLKGTQTIISKWQNGKDDPEMVGIAERLQGKAIGIFEEVVEQEKEWAEHLLGDQSHFGLNKNILCDYIEYMADNRMRAVGLPSSYQKRKNPLPWVTKWLNSDNVQVAPQEVEISSYLIGNLDPSLDKDFLNNLAV